MDATRFARSAFVCALALIVSPLQGHPEQSAEHFKAAVQRPDGLHDFDFEIGHWKTHVSRRLRPLAGSDTWVELEGTTIVSKVWDGRANLAELHVAGPSGRIEGLSLRLYNPDARQWSLNYANSNAGTLTQPTIGEFKDGRGEFFSQEMFDGRPIYVRFVISCATRDTCHFEQAFSADGGKSWEVNWIAIDTRTPDAPAT